MAWYGMHANGTLPSFPPKENKKAGTRAYHWEPFQVPTLVGCGAAGRTVSLANGHWTEMEVPREDSLRGSSSPHHHLPTSPSPGPQLTPVSIAVGGLPPLHSRQRPSLTTSYLFSIFANVLQGCTVDAIPPLGMAASVRRQLNMLPRGSVPLFTAALPVSLCHRLSTPTNQPPTAASINISSMPPHPASDSTASPLTN